MVKDLMEVKINKEISDYEEQFFFGFSLKQCLTLLFIVVIGIILGVLLSSAGVEFDVILFIVILVSLPAAFLGFYSYNGMSAAQSIRAFIRSTFLMPDVLPYVGENIYFELFRSYRKEVRPKVKRDRALRKARSLAPLQDDITVSMEDIILGEPVPQTIDALMTEPSEEEREKEKERILKKELRRKKAIKNIRKAGSLLFDIVIWIVISLLITYIVNRTDVLNIIGEWIQRLFSSAD